MTDNIDQLTTLFSRLKQASVWLGLLITCMPAYCGEERTITGSPWDKNIVQLESLNAEIVRSTPIVFTRADNNPLSVRDDFTYHENSQTLFPQIAPYSEGEKAAILQSHGMVSRTGNALTINLKNGLTYHFDNFARPNLNGGDGESITFTYRGILVHTVFHQIDLDDSGSPSQYLLNSVTGEVLEVEDHYSYPYPISDDGQYLIYIGDTGFSIIALKQAGYSIEVQCRSPSIKSNHKIFLFNGWFPAPNVGFIMMITYSVDQQGTYEAVPARFLLKKDGWHISIPNPQHFNNAANFVCFK